MSKYVPETAIDYDAVFSRGGQNGGDEDFALFKCPNCGHVYLYEYEVDTVYLDGNDLSKRQLSLTEEINCVACRVAIPSGHWAGPQAEERFLVTWEELALSPWSWAAKPQDEG